MLKKSPNTILKTNNLSIGYQQKHRQNLIASGIEIDIQRGELVAVIGINGVGKSTLLRTLSGIQPVLEGKVLLEDQEIHQMDSLQLASLISLVLTEQPISRNLSVFELVALGPAALHQLDRPAKQSRSSSNFDCFKIGEY